jgi:hypothetical protein
LVLALGLAAVGCDDDEGGVGAACSDYCSALDAADCLGGLSKSECGDICQAYVEEEGCGSQYKALAQCAANSEIECMGGALASFPECEGQQNAYFDCAGTAQ